LRRFVRNLFSVYAVNVLNGALGVIFVPVAIAWLGKAGYGLFSIYSVLVGCLALADLGMGKNLARLLASDRSEETQRESLQIALALYVCFSAALLILLPLLLALVADTLFPVPVEQRAAVKWITAIAVLEYCLAVPTGLTQTFTIATERFDRYARFVFVSGLYRYGLLFLGILVFHSPVPVVGLVAARRLADLFVARRLMGNLPRGSWRPRFCTRSMREMLAGSAVLSLAQTLQTAMLTLASVLVNRYFGIAGLGIYRSGFDLASKVWFFSNGLGLVVFPRFASLLAGETNRPQLLARLRAFMRASWAGYNLLAAVGVLAAPVLMRAFKRGDEAIVALFVLLLLGVSINAHANVGYEFVLASARYRLAVFACGLALVSMVVCFFLLRGMTGILAVGWAWIVSQALYAGLVDGSAAFEGMLWSPLQFRLLAFKALILALSIAAVGAYLGLLPSAFRLAALAFLMLFFFGSARRAQAVLAMPRLE